MLMGDAGVREFAMRLQAATEGKFADGRNWKTQPIRECGEALVEVAPGACMPYYAAVMNLTTEQRLFLRQEVRTRFYAARENLWQNWKLELVLFDGWRSIELQEKLFWQCLKEDTARRLGFAEHFVEASQPEAIREAFARLDPVVQRQLRAENEKYSSWPTADPTCPSMHATGGAVDVWIFRNGRPVNLGVTFDTMDERSGTFRHLSSEPGWPGYTEEAALMRDRLIYVMSTAGFAAYPWEFWHWNFGNQAWSLVAGEPAKYGYIEPGK